MSWSEGYFSFNDQPTRKCRQRSRSASRSRHSSWRARAASTSGRASKAAFPMWASYRRSRRHPRAGAVSSTSCHRVGSARAHRRPTIHPWAGDGARTFGLRGGQDIVRSESAGVIVLMDPGTGKRGRPSGPADVPELVAKAERALQAKDLDARAPRPSKPGACSRTTQRSICCSDGFIWRRDTGRPLLRSCGARCGSIPTSPRRIASWDSRSSRWPLCRAVASWTNGSGSLAARRRGATGGRASRARGRPSVQPWLTTSARFPRSLLRIPEPRVPAAERSVASQGPARCGDACRGEWARATSASRRRPRPVRAHPDRQARLRARVRRMGMAVRIAPHHTGALKGLAFLYFKVGDLGQAEAHLELGAQSRARRPEHRSSDRDDAERHGSPGTGRRDHRIIYRRFTYRRLIYRPSLARQRLDEARVFAGLEGANEGLLLIDGAGRVLGGALKDRDGTDVTDTVAATSPACRRRQLGPPSCSASAPGWGCRRKDSTATSTSRIRRRRRCSSWYASAACRSAGCDPGAARDGDGAPLAGETVSKGGGGRSIS